MKACEVPLLQSPYAAQATQLVCESAPQLTVAGEGWTTGAGGRGATATKTGAAVRDKGVITGAGVRDAVGAVVHAGLHDRAQFFSIQARASPLHCPCDAQVAHVACVSVPQLRVVVGGGTGGLLTGAAVAGVIAVLGDKPHEGFPGRTRLRDKVCPAIMIS
jgi:hypothetical protein